MTVDYFLISLISFEAFPLGKVADRFIGMTDESVFYPAPRILNSINQK